MILQPNTNTMKVEIIVNVKNLLKNKKSQYDNTI